MAQSLYHWMSNIYKWIKNSDKKKCDLLHAVFKFKIPTYTTLSQNLGVYNIHSLKTWEVDGITLG